MKVSIRTGILVLFATIFILTGSIIIGVDHYVEDKILLNFAENLISKASNSIEHQIYNFLQPSRERLSFSANLIKNNLITPTNHPAFTKLLLQILHEQPNFSAVFWADPEGNSHILERAPNNKLIDKIIAKTAVEAVASTTYLDLQGNPLDKVKYTKTSFDPRTRPWYKKTITAHKPTLSDVYIFYPSETHKPEPGVTAVYPVYNQANNQLVGMLGIDLKLNTLHDFVANLKITHNSLTFILEKDYDLLAAKSLKDSPSKKVQNMAKLAIPWVTASLEEYLKHKKTIFSYKFAGKKYLAYYKNIKNIVGNNWYIASILPINDVIGAFHATTIKLSLAAIFILCLGMLGIWFAAGAIAKPIVKLTDEASAIKQLELPLIVKIKSLIKEINYLQDTFNSMKQSLGSFARYVPKALVKKLIASGDVAHVGGESKKLTFMFTDIRRFTSIAETMEPQKLMSYLSEYFEVMTKIILERKGTLDKYIGDAIMAFWGAPIADSKHPLHACKSAITMFEELDKLNQHWQQNGLPQLSIRIGINTGKAVVGNVGSDYKLSYTSLGDSVNLTSRLEELNKLYGTQIIISSSTYQLVKDQFYTRLLDNVAVRGKKEGVYIYELLTPINPLVEKLENYNPKFIAAFVAYQQGEWKRAISLFTNMQTDYPEDKLINIYIERCQFFQKNPPTAWQGIWRIELCKTEI